MHPLAPFARVHLAILRFFLFVALLLLPQLALADGSQSYTTPGTYTFTVPAYGTLIVTVNGAGGGGEGGSEEVPPYYNYYGTVVGAYYWIGSNGSGGGESSFNNALVAQGGSGGSQSSMSCAPNYSLPNTSYFYYYSCTSPSPVTGSSGGASGADTDTAGGGAAGGAGGQAGECIPGGCPGYAENAGEIFYIDGGNGGNGGQAVSTYAPGAFSPATNITVVVGQGGSDGASGTGNPTITTNGSAGQNGSVTISWTSPPSCSVTFAQNPLPYGSQTTLAWTSSNATDVYINSVGYVGASGATSVGPLATTDYSCSAGNGTSTSTTAASLTVTPPPSPTATIAASSTSIYVGQSTNVLADFAAGSGDTLTADNIDEPLGTGLGATTNPDTSKTVAFTPSSAGTYTFYPRATTQYYSSWTTYAQVSVTVTAAPQCSVSLSPTSIPQGQSATLSYSSQNSTAFSINNVGSETPDTTNSTSVSPSVTTDYTGAASAGGVTNTCPATLTVSCTPAYSCSGDTIQYTNSSCDVSNVTTCESPAFCSAGSAVCLYPQPQFNENGQYTGHLQVLPSVVLAGNPVTVHWNLSNISSCAVSGTNGDQWTTDSGSETSSPIVQKTTYTLQCTGDDGSSIDELQTVNVVPVFNEI